MGTDKLFRNKGEGASKTLAYYINKNGYNDSMVINKIGAGLQYIGFPSIAYLDFMFYYRQLNL
jgi:hypothetical protein